MASKVIRQAVQYCSRDLYGIRDIYRRTAVKLKVNNIAWDTLGQLGIRGNQRRCRGGVHMQRPMQQLVTSRAPYPMYGTNEDIQPIDIVVRCRLFSQPSTRGVNQTNIVSIETVKIPKAIKQETISVGYLNARSVKAEDRPQDIKDFITDNALDMLAITETWLSPGDKDNIAAAEITPSGYKLLHVPRPKAKGRGEEKKEKVAGGVAVLLKTSFITKKEKVSKFTSFEVMEVTAASKKDSVRVCVIYRPPSTSKTVFLEEFQDYLDSLTHSKGKLVVLGDFNFHYDRRDNAEANKLRELLFSMNLDQHVQAPTHVHGHTLDLVLTRSSEAVVKNMQVHAPVMSDHAPITFSLVTHRPPPERKLISYRKLKQIDMVKFKADIQNSALVHDPSSGSMDEMVEQYNETLARILDQHAPLITKYVKDRSHAPWYNEEVLAAKQMKRKAERKYLKTRLTVHLDMVREARTRLNNICKRAKSNYYKGKIEACAKDQKSLFKFINELMHRGREIRLPDFDDASILANDFAQFFVDKIDRISQTFANNELGSNSGSDADADTPVIRMLQPVSQEDLKKIVLSGNSKCCHLDPVPTSILKECIDILLPSLTNIVNKSVVDHTFPTTFKFATLVPLLKKPSLDKEQFPNYRPVSNLAYVGKLIEKVVVDQMNDFREEHAMHPVNQSAYRKKHSCETALVRITNDILMAMDNRMCVALVMLDLSAAFDTVSHSILLRRLEEDFGVRGNALLWFESYFSGRTQAVNINGTLSIPRPLHNGMPQGSRIGPTEFPLYTSPMFAIAEKHGVQVHMYADDTQLFVPFSVGEYDNAIQKLERCIDEMRTWLANNHLKLNDDKTEFIVVGQKSHLNRIETEMSLVIGNSRIHASQCVKNIGAMIDSQMDMKSHVNNVARACYLHLRNIGRIHPNITVDATATLIHAFISSKIDNLNSLLAGVPDVVLKKLQLIQNNAARLVLKKKKRDHVTPLLRQLHWLPVRYRVKYKICLLTFKALNGLAPSYISEMLTRYHPARNLRSVGTGLLVPRVPRLKCTGGRAFSITAPKMWNSLPVGLRTCTNVDGFKRDLKTHLFREAFN